MILINILTANLTITFENIKAISGVELSIMYYNDHLEKSDDKNISSIGIFEGILSFYELISGVILLFYKKANNFLTYFGIF